MTRLQKNCGIALLIVLLILALTTYISRQIAHARVPSVTVGMPSKGNLTETHTVTAKVAWATELIETASANYTVAEVSTRVGAYAEKGDVLLKLDESALELERLRLEEALEKAEDKDVSEASAYAQALHAKELETLKASLAEVEKYIGAHGYVTADANGYVRSFAPVGDVRTGGMLVELGCTEDGATLTWTMSENAAIPTGLTTSCFLRMYSFDDEGEQVNGEQEVDVSILRREFQSDSGKYVYSTGIIPLRHDVDGKPWTLNMSEGQSVELVFTERSKESYILIPRSAVSIQPGNIGKVFTLYTNDDGTYEVREKQFNIEDENDQYIATEGSFTQEIILYTDKALRSGVTVNRLN